MIIDVHHHMIPTFADDNVLTAHAQFYHRAYGGGGRSERVDTPVEEVKRRFQSYSPDPDGEKLQRRMSQAGIDITIMCMVDHLGRYPADGDLLKANRTLAEFANRTGGKVLALAGIDPRRKEAPELYRRCIEEYGMRGLKWHADLGHWPNDEAAYRLLQVAEQLGTPLLTHTGLLPGFAWGEHARTKYVQVGLLDEVAQDFPDLKIIAAHMGRFDWRQWAQYRPNLYGDLAMWQVWAVVNYERFCRDLREILDIAGTDSVLFGTDAPSFSALVPNEQFVQILRGLPRKAPLGLKFTEEEVAAILGGNAQKVFGL